MTEARETSFPFSLIFHALTMKVQEGKASKVSDKIRILHSIVSHVGDLIHSVPPIKQPMYERVNNSLQTMFVTTSDRLAKASRFGDETWE